MSFSLPGRDGGGPQSIYQGSGPDKAYAAFDPARRAANHSSMPPTSPPVNATLREGQYRDGSNLAARFRLHQRFSTSRYPLHRWVFDRFTFPEGGRVLELGCGFGALWKTNRDRIPPHWNVVLSDFSFGMLLDARTDLKSVGTFRFQQIDAIAIPYRDAALDGVIANHMLYHVTDLEGVLREIRRALKPSGVLYASTIGPSHLRELDVIAEPFIGVAPLSRVHQRFGLANGAAALRKVFSDVGCETVRGELRISEVEPVLDYFRSMNSTRLASPDTLSAIRARIEREIAGAGALRVSTESGLFIARP
jgi:SAM-dependent methyltransferase